MKTAILLLALLMIGCKSYQPVFTFEYVRFHDGSQITRTYQGKKVTKDSVVIYSRHIMQHLDSLEN